MDVNGCGWVRMGAMWYRGTGGHKNKASIEKNGLCRARFGSYGRGNFPGHHVLGCLTKSGVYGCRWVYIDSYA